MADNAPAPVVVNPPTGPMPPPPPVPAPVTRRPARLRTANAPLSGATAFPDATGVPSVLAFAENYSLTSNYQLVNSTYIASSLAMFAWIYHADTRMAQNDRFLRSNPLWHPLITQLYVSFLYFLHLLRVCEVSGSLSPHQSTVFAALKEKYPLSHLPVPGYLVHVFSSITATAAPYDWLGNIIPAIPDLTGWTQANAYRLANGLDALIPNIWLIIDQINVLATAAVIADNTSFDFFHNIFGNNLTNVAAHRHVLNAPNARFPVSLSGRVDRAFQIFVSRTVGNARVLNTNILDLPLRPTPGQSNNVDNLEFYLGLFDLTDTPNRINRMYTWLDQILPAMSAYCRFINDSRPLSSISVSGLGAATPIWQYSANTIKIGDPFANPATTAVEAAIASMRVRDLEAASENRDPEIDAIAVQYSAAAQVNVDLSLNGTVPDENHLRTGPFWHMPVSDTGADFRLEGMITASIGTSINYVSR